MAHHLILPGPVVPKARPRFDSRSRRAYTSKRYAEWLAMASEYVALTRRGASFDGNLALSLAFAPGGVEVLLSSASPVRRHLGTMGDIDNLAGSVMDALQLGELIANDRQIVKLTAWIAEDLEPGGDDEL